MPDFTSGSLFVWTVKCSPGFFWIMQVVVMLSSDLQVVNCHELKKSLWMLSSPFLDFICCWHWDLGIQSLLPVTLWRGELLFWLCRMLAPHIPGEVLVPHYKPSFPIFGNDANPVVLPWKLYFCLKDLFRPPSPTIFWCLKSKQK